ncbi:flagellar assembly protein FliW [Clostridium niameyense]|uniref:Flagellar assembly factor FliW n=1 Tax=Clostridium niameyense TaxID=1622073 RepID=A0A6M0R6R9_9CLOT|nr:flagellar assembly protein FliW [Clostridium niameyense]NEZ45864.1 flagellar assembly protein FliW [Clostridium niameyense]
MKLKTKYHGIIDYKKEDILYFPKGIPGFEKLKEFIIFPVEDNDIFSVLHSIGNEEIGIIVISPFRVDNSYEFKLEEEQVKRLKIDKKEDLIVLNTVTIYSNIKDITVNLRAPIVINIKDKIGEQIILNSDKYSIKHPLFKEEV